MQFTPKTPVRELWATWVDAKPRDYDFWEHEWGADWDYTEAGRCECGEIVVGSNKEDAHCYLDCNSDCEEYVSLEGPMMNYIYPVDTKRIGGMEWAARALVCLPLCMVEIGGEHYMALTGGGMDLSWEICEGYMRLGYLPPTHFYNLPQYSGKPLNTRNKWILAGMRRGLLMEKERTTWALKKVRDLRARMKEA
ncbi:MAG: hypothetical protein ACXABY_23025 [Candidatus Thorarchaeota archaeon]|jgi:hypothetical protein